MDSKRPHVSFSALLRSSADEPGAQSVGRILSAVRAHLDMDIAFVSRFRERDRIFTHVDAEGPAPIQVGDVLSLEDGYCQKVVDGRLPELISDTRRVPATADIAATHEIPIGSHMSVPIRLSDGSLYGTFCCFGFQADPSLSERDLQFMRAFAELASSDIEQELQRADLREKRAANIRRAIDVGQPDIVYQPILNLAQDRVEGFECLSRFNMDPARPPDQWFREAKSVGLSVELELAAIAKALRHQAMFPRATYLSVNCSPEAILSRDLACLLDRHDCRRVVIEVTEHDSIRDYPALLRGLKPLRARGVRIAIDDTGSGYASLRHVLQLDPDKIKLDVSLTRGIDRDVKRQALAAALVAFAHRTRGVIVAEGVETLPEQEALTRLGVDCLQGYLIGRPMRLEKAIEAAGRGQTV